jgi:glycine cleavage system aminomethyltransferase T
VYLPPVHASPGTEVAVEIFGRWVEGELAEEPLFDPSGARLRN